MKVPPGRLLDVSDKDVLSRLCKADFRYGVSLQGSREATGAARLTHLVVPSLSTTLLTRRLEMWHYRKKQSCVEKSSFTEMK